MRAPPPYLERRKLLTSAHTKDGTIFDGYTVACWHHHHVRTTIVLLHRHAVDWWFMKRTASHVCIRIILVQPAKGGCVRRENKLEGDNGLGGGEDGKG
jgi:hypothetical protein